MFWFYYSIILTGTKQLSHMVNIDEHTCTMYNHGNRWLFNITAQVFISWNTNLPTKSLWNYSNVIKGCTFKLIVQSLLICGTLFFMNIIRLLSHKLRCQWQLCRKPKTSCPRKVTILQHIIIILYLLSKKCSKTT